MRLLLAELDVTELLTIFTGKGEASSYAGSYKIGIMVS